MVRTVVSLETDDKAWLDRRAEREQVPMTEIVRRAVKLYRQESEKQLESGSMRHLLEQTSGLWQGGDGLDYQSKIREEWDDSP